MAVMDHTSGDTPAESDTAPRKSKQSFLKRGEGVKRRIDAYKYRKPLKPSEKAIKEDQSGPSDQSEQHSPYQHVQRYAGQLSYVNCSDNAPAGFELSETCLPDDARGRPATGASGVWSAPQTEEDLELEEFRALEREIWGGSQQGGKVQQKQQQQPTSQESMSAASAPAAALLSPEAAEAAAMAAYGSSGLDIDDDNLDLGHDSSTRMVRFQDETEWVDTEFSFDGGMPQQPTGGAGQQAQQPQQPHQQLQQQQQQQTGLSPAKLAADAGADGMLSQPYVRAIFASKGGTGRMNGVSSANRSGRQQQHQVQQVGNQDPAAHQDDCQPDAQTMQQQMVAVPADLVQKWQQWEAAQPSLQQDKADLYRMRQELEKAATRLEQERQAWEKQKAAAQASLEAWRSEEARRLGRERRVLEQQSKALLKLPSKKEKSALDALQQQMDKERSEAKAAAARHRLTVERLRCQIKELQDRTTELREEVRWHEAQQLNATAFAAADARSRRKPPTNTAQTQTDGCLAQGPSPTTAAAVAAAAAADRLEAGGQHMQQMPAPAAAKLSDPLYAALFGDDEGDDDFAAAEQAAAAAGPASAASGKLMAYHQDQSPGHKSALHSAAAASNGTSGSSRGQQQADSAATALHLGRRIGSSVTLKPGVTWADSPQKQLMQQKQQQQQHVQQPQQLQQAGNSSNGSHWPAAGHGEQDSVDDFSFPVAVQQTDGNTCSGASSHQQQQQWQQQEQHNMHHSSSSPVYDPYMKSDQHNLFHTNYNSDYGHDSQQQHQHHVQQQQQRLTASGDSRYTTASQAAAAVAAVSATAGYANGSSRQFSAPPVSAAVGCQLLQELQHADGKLEQWLSDGSRVLHFANGTVKTTRCDGSVCIRFTNGDVKRQSADGRVDYYYAEVATWQSTHPCGIEVFYFPTGQVEGHHADGVMDILFPDGTIKRVTPDGSEQDITAGLLPAAVQLPPPELNRL